MGTCWRILYLYTELVDVFLLNFFFQLVLGTKFIQQSNMVMTLVLLKIVESGNLKTFCFYLFIFLNIGLMVGFKTKARASAYLTNWGGYVGGFLWVGCVWGMDMIGVVGVC